MKKFVWFFSVCLLLGSSQVFALSEKEEIKLGQAEHRKITARYGVYRDKSLQEYITMVGQRVASESSRPELEFHFTILNDDIINAFALPGGYVYITRGMLTHMNSESELAAVLGHEVAHITEKHAIKRQNRQKGLNILNTVLAIGTGQPGLYELGNIFGGVLITGYSREFELEADEVGAQYMAKAGYSPEAMLKTIEILKAKDRIEIKQARIEKRKPNVYHGFLSSHPDHDTRYEKAIRASEKLLRDYDEFIKTDEFLEKLNGLSWGNARKVGVVRKNKFYHPKLGIKLSFPKGWRMEQARRGVQIVSAIADASFFISTDRLYKGATPQKFATEKLAFNVREGREISIGGLPAYIGIADRADSPFGPRPVRFAVLFDPRKHLAFILQGAGKHDLRNIANDKDFITTIFSFDRMNRDDFKIAKAPRVQIVRAEEDTTMEALAAQSPITNYALDKLRVINGLYPDGQPEPGQLIKVID
ncbi:MAG: M48 family metalloprotease [Gammaproteobacteria bacterium]|nr:M48 family metalloprotease [Gammaproteobacteria bacterium]